MLQIESEQKKISQIKDKQSQWKVSGSKEKEVQLVLTCFFVNIISTVCCSLL